MNPTDSIVVFCDAILDLLVAHKDELGIQDVYWGDQVKIPRVPSVCVEPTIKSRDLQGVPRRTLNTFEAYVIIYHARLQDVQITARESALFAEAVETVFHLDAQFSGLFIHTLCTSIEPGFATRAGTNYRASRLTCTGISKLSLPQSA